MLIAYSSGPGSDSSGSQKTCWTLCSICCWRVWKGMLKLSPSARVVNRHFYLNFNFIQWLQVKKQYPAMNGPAIMAKLGQDWAKVGIVFKGLTTNIKLIPNHRNLLETNDISKMELFLRCLKGRRKVCCPNTRQRKSSKNFQASEHLRC